VKLSPFSIPWSVIPRLLISHRPQFNTRKMFITLPPPVRTWLPTPTPLPATPLMSVDLKLWTVTSADAHSGKHPFFCWRRELKGRKNETVSQIKTIFWPFPKRPNFLGCFRSPSSNLPLMTKTEMTEKDPPLLNRTYELMLELEVQQLVFPRFFQRSRRNGILPLSSLICKNSFLYKLKISSQLNSPFPQQVQFESVLIPSPQFLFKLSSHPQLWRNFF